MKIFQVLTVLLFVCKITGISQTNYRFQKKISGLLSKDKVEKAEDYCSSLKSEKERAGCYSFMGDKALEENEYSLALDYFLKSANETRQHDVLLHAINEGEQHLIENYYIRKEKSFHTETNKTIIEQSAYKYIADLCYKLKDYKNAADYYQKANVAQLSYDCKVLYSIEQKDYIGVIELSEKETVGLKNTMELYSMAAEQYQAAGNYGKAADCYKKTGNKAKAKSCFYKAKEDEMSNLLKSINNNPVDFLKDYRTIKGRLESIAICQEKIDKIVTELRNNKLNKTAYDWQNISEYLSRIMTITTSEAYLECDNTHSIAAKTELENCWSDFNKYIGIPDLNLVIKELHHLEIYFNKFNEIHQSFNSEINGLVKKIETKVKLNETSTFYFLDRSVKAIEKEMVECLRKTENAENTKAENFLNWCLLRELNKRINKRADKLIASSTSDNLQLKFEELKQKHKAFYINLLEGSNYLKDDFQPTTWEEYILQKSIKGEISY